MPTATLIPRSTSNLEPAEATEPLRAVHSTNFPGLLQQLGASLLVTNYQAGKLVLVRDKGTTSTPASAPSRRQWAWTSTAPGWPSLLSASLVPMLVAWLKLRRN